MNNEKELLSTISLNLNLFLLASPEEIHEQVCQFIETGKINIEVANEVEKELLNLQEQMNLQQAEFEKRNSKYLN